MFRGTGPAEAWFVRDWLERNGLAVWVRDGSSMRGQLPVDEAWPSVWVRADDRTAAEAAMRAYHAPQLVHPRWRCGACGEDNEANFGSCWNCEADRV